MSSSTLERIRLAYSPAEAAELLDLSRAQVYNLMAAGVIASVKIGRSRRIRHDVLVAYLDSLQGTPDEAA